jgi:hypothetical protein
MSGFRVIEAHRFLSTRRGSNRALGRLPTQKTRRHENKCGDCSRKIETDFPIHVQVVAQLCIAPRAFLVRASFLLFVQKVPALPLSWVDNPFWPGLNIGR